jgi:hypothetical protein
VVDNQVSDLEELNRRLTQARRMIAEPVDPLTKERLRGLVADIETQIAAVESREADTPSNSIKR